VCADNPSLLFRGEGGGELMRIVIDSKGITPFTATVLTDPAAARTIIFTSVSTPHATINGWCVNGASVELLQPDASGFLPLADVMRKLGQMGLMHVVCEGGGVLAGALHSAALIDEYILFYAPAILGDTQAKRGFSFNSACALTDLKRMKIRDHRMFGDDLCIRMLAKNREHCKACRAGLKECHTCHV
jgi:diaminohydroxyphosphoribosylaminopyrimidine deaminase/5-amino-6-(5-phosphoribosylamino)uracil reductase